MSMILAVALSQMAVPAPVGTTPDAHRAVSLWIGADDRLSFDFGRALSRALAASATVRQAVPIAGADYRLVLRRPGRAASGGTFTYAADLIRPPEAGRRRTRERVIATTRGRCTTATLDACAGAITNYLSSRLGS